MTQPPCAENVLWIVVNEPLSVSTTVLSMFMDVLHNYKDKTNTNYGNNRIIQPLHNR